MDIGKSSNSLYVSKINTNSSIFYTVLHTSCKTADNPPFESVFSDEIIIDKVYEKFRSKQVERITDNYYPRR